MIHEQTNIFEPNYLSASLEYRRAFLDPADIDEWVEQLLHEHCVPSFIDPVRPEEV